MMEWVPTVTSGLVVMLLVGPLVVMLAGLVLFGLVGQVLRSRLMVSRTTFDCPFSKQRASVEFLGDGGASDRPADVLSCSVFAPRPYHVRCEKACLGLAETWSAMSPMMPRYALLSGGVAYRAAPANGSAAPETTETSQMRTAG